MPFHEYWEMLIESNDGLKDKSNSMRISASVFRKCLEKAYLAGAEDAKNEIAKDTGMAGTDLFNQLFGGFSKKP